MDNGTRPQMEMEEADLTNPEILKYYFLLCNKIVPGVKKKGIQEFKYLKKELVEKFNLDFRLVDVVNKYREIHYKLQIWEKFIENKESILALTCTADVSWLQSKSEECLDTISVDKEGQPSIGLLKFVFGSSANGSKGSNSLKPTATIQEHVGDSSRDLELHEPKTNSSNEISHNISSESSKCVRLGYCPKRIKMNGSRWTRTALEDEVFRVNKAMRMVSKTSGSMSNEHLYLFSRRLLVNPRERSGFCFVKPSLRLRYLQEQFKKYSTHRVIPEPTQPTGADPRRPNRTASGSDRLSLVQRSEGESSPESMDRDQQLTVSHESRPGQLPPSRLPSSLIKGGETETERVLSLFNPSRTALVAPEKAVQFRVPIPEERQQSEGPLHKKSTEQYHKFAPDVKGDDILQREQHHSTAFLPEG